MAKNAAIIIKTREEIILLREAGKILARVVNRLKSSLTANMTTQEIDVLAEEFIRAENVVPAFKGYRGFPGCACVSVNQEVVHGIGSLKRVQDGDIVSIDVGIIHKNFYSDMAVTVEIGNVDQDIRALCQVTRQALFQGIAKAREGNRLTDISHAIQTHAEKHGFSIVREFVGHGIGRRLHEEPEIPNYGDPHQGPLLKEGMVFAIEPMVNLGKPQTRILSDGWTVVTQDGSPSAHFEHTVAITKNEPEILTLLT